jgi:hypothetical protein
MYDLYALFDYLIGPLLIIGVAGTAAVRCPRLLPRLLLSGILGALLGGIPSHLMADHFILAPIRDYFNHLAAIHYHGFLCGNLFSRDLCAASRVTITGCWVGGAAGVSVASFMTGWLRPRR